MRKPLKPSPRDQVAHLLKPLEDEGLVDRLAELQDEAPELPSLEATLQFLENHLPMWWPGNHQQLLDRLNYLGDQPSVKERVRALRELLDALRRGLLKVDELSAPKSKHSSTS